MKKFIGIDLHSNNSVVVVSDEEDRAIFQKRMANDLKLIEATLARTEMKRLGWWSNRRTTGTGWSMD